MKKPFNPATLPVVGLGVSKLSGSDSYAGTIVSVSPDNRSFEFYLDEARVVKGSTQDGSAEYEHTQLPNQSGDPYKAKWTFRQGKGAFRCDNSFVTVGVRRTYYDPHR